MKEIEQRLKFIQGRIEEALKRSPYGQKEVVILGASKTQSVLAIREAAEQGLNHMGENYVQELLKKAPLCHDTSIKWHFIGRLQSNKVKQLLPFVSSIDSVDSVSLAKRISKLHSELPSTKSPLPIHILVNLGGEKQKAGLSPESIEVQFEDFLKIDGVSVEGLMCIPPLSKNGENTRGYFKRLKKLFDELKERHSNPEKFKVLSMGMSGDYEMAVEEGSTCVRLGEALFGPRPKKE